MFAVYAREVNLEDPLASLVVGERPDPVVKEGWVRVKVTHASLNRHDVFTLRGLSAQQEPIPFPMIMGNDGAQRSAYPRRSLGARGGEPRLVGNTQAPRSQAGEHTEYIRSE